MQNSCLGIFYETYQFCNFFFTDDESKACIFYIISSNPSSSALSKNNSCSVQCRSGREFEVAWWRDISSRPEKEIRLVLAPASHTAGEREYRWSECSQACREQRGARPFASFSTLYLLARMCAPTTNRTASAVSCLE